MREHGHESIATAISPSGTTRAAILGDALLAATTSLKFFFFFRAIRKYKSAARVFVRRAYLWNGSAGSPVWGDAASGRFADFTELGSARDREAMRRVGMRIGRPNAIRRTARVVAMHRTMIRRRLEQRLDDVAFFLRCEGGRGARAAAGTQRELAKR